MRLVTALPHRRSSEKAKLLVMHPCTCVLTACGCQTLTGCTLSQVRRKSSHRLMGAFLSHANAEMLEAQ